MDNAEMDTHASSPAPHDLSPKVAAALIKAEKITQWIDQHHPGQILETRNHRLAAGHFAICLEHREATLLLISEKMHGSAFALWRPTYENYMRGHWSLNVANDQDFQKIAKTKALPKFETVIKRLDGVSGSSMFAKSKAKVWDPMSDFAHGGIKFLTRWSGPEGIGSNHPDEEVLDLITRVNTYGILACMGICYMAGEHGFPVSIFSEKLKELLAGIQGPT